MPGSVERPLVEAIVERLRAARELNGGRLPAGWIDEAANACGVGRSTLLRYLRQGIPAAPSPDDSWRWEAESREAYYRAAGSVSLARRLLAEERGEEGLPSLKTMYRAAHRDFAPDEQALARLGERAARGKRLVCAIENVHRNEVWLADHKLLDVFVLPPRGTRPVRPWMTVLIDGYSRRAVGASLSLTPSRGHVLSALGMAIRQCGTPQTLVFDRGKEFLSAAVAEHAAALGYAAIPTLAYHPHHKGKVERFHQTLNAEIATALGVVPEPAVTIRDTALLGPSPPVSWQLMVSRFFATLDAYNATRPHRALDGQTPQAVYDADPTPQRMVPEPLLRRFLLAHQTRKITEHGIRFGGRHYWAPEIEGHRGSTVEIRYAQDDQRQIELYRHETHWCTAGLVDPASPTQHARVMAARHAHTERQRRDLRLAKRKSREAWKAVAAGDYVVETTIITAAEADRETSGTPAGMRAALRSLGISTDLDNATSTDKRL